MASTPNGPRFVGCATDHKFVPPTCAMLSSLDDNGEVPDATVLVADFGLTDEDRAQLRDSAGRLGAAMRFVAIDRDSPKIVALPSSDIPLPLLGRLILPREVDEPGARLLLLDSDMVVNGSMAPLFAMDMAGHPVAAAQDPLMYIDYHHHRKPKPVYFNAGLMLLDLDLFNARSIGEACMYRLSRYEKMPHFMDQCALNEELEGDWLDLGRSWNFFQTGNDRHFHHEDYLKVQVIHFAGHKPWVVDWHPAGSIWNHHASRAQLKMTRWRDRLELVQVDRALIAMQYEVLLGRELESETVAADRAPLSLLETVRIIVTSEEFGRAVLAPLRQGRPLPDARFRQPLSRAARWWAIDRLPVLPGTAQRIEAAADWRALLAALVGDGRFMGAVGLEPFAAADAARPEPEPEPAIVAEPVPLPAATARRPWARRRA